MNFQSEIVIKKSKFISYTFEITSKDEVKKIIKLFKEKEHKKATHICSAYLLFQDGRESAGFDDDGEPSKTAGRPIYDLLRIKELFNVLVIVVRYFGGIKLGAGGLQKAYRESAKLTIDNYLKEKHD